MKPFFVKAIVAGVNKTGIVELSSYFCFVIRTYSQNTAIGAPLIHANFEVSVAMGNTATIFSD
jgi:hypothetical protein